MNRDEVKRLLPVIMAYADGKEIQRRTPPFGEWEDVFDISYYALHSNDFEHYRIKPSSHEIISMKFNDFIKFPVYWFKKVGDTNVDLIIRFSKDNFETGYSQFSYEEAMENGYLWSSNKTH